jgi:hypothetical protein
MDVLLLSKEQNNYIVCSFGVFVFSSVSNLEDLDVRSRCKCSIRATPMAIIRYSVGRIVLQPLFFSYSSSPACNFAYQSLVSIPVKLSPTRICD